MAEEYIFAIQRIDRTLERIALIQEYGALEAVIWDNRADAEMYIRLQTRRNEIKDQLWPKQ